MCARSCLIGIKLIALFQVDLILGRSQRNTYQFNRFPSARRMLLFERRILFQSARAPEIPFVNGAVLIKP